MKNPFEQFELNILQKLTIADMDFSITNFTIYLFLGTLLIVIFYKSALVQNTLISNNFQIIIEFLYTFILGLIIEQTGIKGLRFFPVLFTYLILYFLLTY